MRPWMIRLVVRLYPAPVRDRYGAEITELLAASTRPWPDLADVGRAAFGERMAASMATSAKAWTWGGAGVQVRRLAWIATVPWSLTLATLLVAIAPLTFIQILDQYAGLHAGRTTINVAAALGIVPICVEAAWCANRRARGARPVAAVVTVPAALAAGTVTIRELLGNEPTGLLLAVAVWCAATIALGVAGRLLARRRGLATLVLVAGSAVALDLSCAAWAIATHRVGSDGLSALTVWPFAVSGLAGSPDDPMVDIMGLPVMLTLCAAYALPLVASVRRGPLPGPRQSRGRLRRSRGRPARSCADQGKVRPV